MSNYRREIFSGGGKEKYVLNLIQSFDFSTIASQVNNRGIFVSPNGQYIYLTTYGTQRCEWYEMITPYDLTSSVFKGVERLGGSSLTAITISDDGTKAVTTRAHNNTVYSWSLSTPWDITTAVNTGGSNSPGGGGYSFGLPVSADGLIMLSTGHVTGQLNEWHLATPWNTTGMVLANSQPGSALGVNGLTAYKDNIIVANKFFKLAGSYELPTTKDLIGTAPFSYKSIPTGTDYLFGKGTADQIVYKYLIEKL